MASRMDRYYQSNNKRIDRSTKNKDLYKKVNTNSKDIASISSINRYNEIDISKIKDIVNNRETYKKEKELRQTMQNSSLKFSIPEEMNDNPVYDVMDIKPEKIEKIELTTPKNYDLSDVLNKAKDEHNENDTKNRNLKNLEYTDLNSLNLHNKEYKDSEAELKDLINTIHNTSKLHKLGDDVGLLDELKADTMVGDASSIKKVLEKEINEEKKDDTKELDKSFFTSAYDFNDDDFDEELAKHSKKKEIIIVIIISLVVAITISTLYFLGILNFHTK